MTGPGRKWARKLLRKILNGRPVKRSRRERFA